MTAAAAVAKARQDVSHFMKANEIFRAERCGISAGAPSARAPVRATACIGSYQGRPRRTLLDRHREI